MPVGSPNRSYFRAASANHPTLALTGRAAARIGPRFQRLGAAAFAVTYPLVRLAGALTSLHSPRSAYAQERIASMRQKLERGETVYVLGIGPGGHNTGVGLVEASKTRGIRLIANHEEERFRAIKHFQRYPGMSVEILGDATEAAGYRAAADSRGLRELGLSVLGRHRDKERGAGAAGQPAVAHTARHRRT